MTIVKCVCAQSLTHDSLRPHGLEIGLIPNCAASVVITQMYLEGLLTCGQLMAGLLVGAGVGLLVLFRTNNHHRENIAITASLLVLGIGWGILIDMLGIVF